MPSAGRYVKALRSQEDYAKKFNQRFSQPHLRAGVCLLMAAIPGLCSPVFSYDGDSNPCTSLHAVTSFWKPRCVANRIVF